MLRATDLHVALSGKTVLVGVDFTARAGEVTAIAGPNGSGKSTLLKALAGEIGSSGTIVLNGRDMRALKGWELAACRAVLPQATTLAFPFTAQEIVALGCRAGIAAADPGLPARALARVGLAGYGARYYQELSGGEQQRVQIARILAQVWLPVLNGTPSWLLLDEPVSSLDIGHQLEIMRIMQDYAAAGGGVIAVMHDLNLTAIYAASVVLMQEGRIIAEGTPQEVLTDTHLSRAYGCALHVNRAPQDAPFLLPHPSAAQPLPHSFSSKYS